MVWRIPSLKCPTIWCCPQIRALQHQILDVNDFGVYCQTVNLSINCQGAPSSQYQIHICAYWEIQFNFRPSFNWNPIQWHWISVGWWRYIRLNWLHLCDISPNFRWKFNRVYLGNDNSCNSWCTTAHCLDCIVKFKKTELQILKLESQSCFGLCFYTKPLNG